MRKRINHLTDSIIAMEGVKYRALIANKTASGEDWPVLSRIIIEASKALDFWRNLREGLEKGMGRESKL